MFSDLQVPIGGCYRLIDIPMSNCINSGIKKIFILTQFNSFSLNRHLARTYNFGDGMNFGDGFVEVRLFLYTQIMLDQRTVHMIGYVLVQFRICTLNHIAFLLQLTMKKFNNSKTNIWKQQVLAATQTPGEAGKKWFQGTADAVRQFIWVFEVGALILQLFFKNWMEITKVAFG